MFKFKLKEYQDNLINIEELIHFFDTNNFTDKEQKENGIIYTPKHISDYIITILSPKLDESIFEPSIGHGIFVFSLLEYIEKEFNLNALELKEYLIKNVFGQDIKQQNIEEFIEILKIYFKKKNIDIKNEEIINNFKIGNTLLYNRLLAK